MIQEWLCGYTDIVEQVLRRRENQPQIKVFNEVEPNPSTHTVYKGLEMFINFQPDTIIALGGGSAMDAKQYGCSLSIQKLHFWGKTKVLRYS